MTSPQPQNGTGGASLRSLWTKVSAVPGDATSDRPSTSYAGHSSPPVRRHSRLVGSVGRSLQDLVSFLDEVHGAGAWRVWRVRTRDDRATGPCWPRQSPRARYQKWKGDRATQPPRSLLYGLRSWPGNGMRKVARAVGVGNGTVRRSRGRYGRPEGKRRVGRHKPDLNHPRARSTLQCGAVV
jgi:hypothetical protein